MVGRRNGLQGHGIGPPCDEPNFVTMASPAHSPALVDAAQRRTMEGIDGKMEGRKKKTGRLKQAAISMRKLPAIAPSNMPVERTAMQQKEKDPVAASRSFIIAMHGRRTVCPPDQPGVWPPSNGPASRLEEGTKHRESPAGILITCSPAFCCCCCCFPGITPSLNHARPCDRPTVRPIDRSAGFRLAGDRVHPNYSPRVQARPPGDAARSRRRPPVEQAVDAPSLALGTPTSAHRRTRDQIAVPISSMASASHMARQRPGIPLRDASIGGAGISSTPLQLQPSRHHHQLHHNHQVLSAENSPPSFRDSKGKGRAVDVGEEPTSHSRSSPPGPALPAPPAPSASAKTRARSPAREPFIEPRKSSLHAPKPAFTRADDRGPLQKLELELKRIGKEEGLVGSEPSASTGVSRTLSRKQAQRLLRSTEVTSKQTAIGKSDPQSGAEDSSRAPRTGFQPGHTARSASLPSPTQPSEGTRRFSASFAERARQEQEQGTVRKPREPVGFAVMETLPPPGSGTHTPISTRSANGQTPAPSSSRGEPVKIAPKVVDRSRHHLHHRHRAEPPPAPTREGIYLDLGQEPAYPPDCAHICLSDLDLVEDEGEIPPVPASSGFDPPLKVKCGPLLRYTGLKRDGDIEVWRGSILIVTEDAVSTYEPVPSIRLFGQGCEIPAEGTSEDDITSIPAMGSHGETEELRPASDLPSSKDASNGEKPGDLASLPPSMRYPFAPATNWPKSGSGCFRKDGERQGKARDFSAERIHAERGVTFWRFNLEIELGNEEQRIAYRINNGATVGFYVPAVDQSMNIMFHSCNGFSLAVDPNNFCGPDPLWRDVLRNHAKRPFHVMLGGGDQLYNDCVSVQAPKFKEWLAIKDQSVKTSTPFDEEFVNELEEFYLNRYAMWFAQGLFGVAGGQIPQANCFDDHDIIDGFGSYPEHFNGCPVFAGLGSVAFKYYLLFQHHTPLSEGEVTEPSWVLGAQPGPFIREPSRSTFMFLGRRVAFLALDCRTERTREELLSNGTYTRVFQRLESEIIPGETKHLIILLGVPIAYPRLVWLENILTSSLMNPIKYIASKRSDGTMNGFLNKFDGGVELLDDMMDHWTARGHKRERNWLILEMQKLAQAKDCRVTFLGYMVNVVSSAIVNTPPPNALADLLNKRNKVSSLVWNPRCTADANPRCNIQVHKLQRDTHEEQVKIFFTDPKGKPRNNNTTLPARNYCRISENRTGTHVGEYEDDITKPMEAQTETDVDFTGGLDLVINFEVDQTDPAGHTKAYGFTTPVLRKPEAAEA
ncbi:hypothetical protein Dda_7626 [Drechslerella dactyloides]|uniref:PhoD-like phosphatase domain-containing protein n=1 Tax=Drechslerella dactyloides TaxID=74499 RepID=A0AAD6ISZ6_DREDA|nr:hypothetical protein Dda_7626 [Drechslerella dactyloides]